MQSLVFESVLAYRDIDWNEVWRHLYEENASCRGVADCSSIWATRDKARAFLAEARAMPERILHAIEGLPLKTSSKVLDIGAGPGTLAIPLAARVAHVTAVEPAAGMVEVMQEYAAEEKVSNLSVVQKRWEDIDIYTDLNGPYDIVIARYSLGMPNIKKAIEMMCEVSSGWVYLFWFAGKTTWENMMSELWPKLHGREYRPGPKSDVLYNVLYSMGIFPNMETSRMEYVRRFDDIDAAVAEFREQYMITSHNQEEILREHLSKILSRSVNGLHYSGIMTGVKLWWSVTDIC